MNLPSLSLLFFLMSDLNNCSDLSNTVSDFSLMVLQILLHVLYNNTIIMKKFLRRNLYNPSKVPNYSRTKAFYDLASNYVSTLKSFSMIHMHVFQIPSVEHCLPFLISVINFIPCNFYILILVPVMYCPCFLCLSSPPILLSPK